MEKIKKMKHLKNKNITSMLAILLMLSFIVSMFTLPNANAQTNDTKSWPFVDAAPKTVGVGQPILISAGLMNPLNDNADGWNMTIHITDPDGKIETFQRKTFATGSIGFYYTPTKEGNYTVYCTFERTQYRSVWYSASESENATFSAVEGFWYPMHPGHKLPTEYWSRPIDGQLREWYSIAGSWVYKPKNLYAPYNEAPGSAHILWSTPIGDTMGGLSGGDAGAAGFQDGDGYEGKFLNSITICGVLYYNRYVAASPQQTIVAVDLHTGKTLWERSYSFGGSRVAHGQILVWDFASSHGAWSYVWMVNGNNWYGLDAATGDLKYNMTNVPSGTIYRGSNGEMLKYRMYNYGTAANPNWYLQQWNSTYVVNNGTRTGTADAWGANVQGRSYDATRLGFDLNISIPAITFVPGQANTGATVAPIMAYAEDRVIFGNVSKAGVTLTGISLDTENRGYPLFNRRTWDSPPEWQDIGVTASQSGWAGFSDEHNVAVYWTKENRVNYGFSTETGKLLWQTEPQIYADAWGGVSSSRDVPEKIIVHNKLIEASVGGVVYCYDVETGKILWTYEATSKTTEYQVMTGNWWLIPVIATEDTVFFGHHEHSAATPKKRGAPFFALNITDGALLWDIEGAFRQTRWGGPAVIGDSIIATMDTYDQQIYGIGKGPSAMTVTSPDIAVTANTPFVIRGTIMDLSPGTNDEVLQMRFPNGVPAVADESMSEWMLHVYKQFEKPMDTKGVDISIWAFDPNGNEVHIGDTTSDASGKFSYTYTPTTAGDHEIYAYFMGSKSYYGTYAKTDITVMAAPEIIQVETPPYEWYIIGAAIAIIAAIAINIIVTLKKK
jgi:outer membrane protein assembly factor BamB